MAFNIYSTQFLWGAYSTMDRPATPIKDTFFKDTILFNTGEVYFDRVDRARRVAPFVSPLVQGKAELLRGSNAVSFRPGYVKPKHVLTPDKLLYRRPGEGFGGDLSLSERLDAIVADAMMLQDYQISRREELMCMEMLLTGKLTTQSEDYPEGAVVDMGRPAANTIVLSGNSTWGSSNLAVDPVDDLQTWNTLLASESGAGATMAIMDPLAWAKFRRSASAQLILNTYRQTTGNFDVAGASVGGYNNQFKLVGSDIGGLDIYLYQQYYTDPNGNQQSVMPPNTVILGNPEMAKGASLYGAILDFDSGLVATPRYPSMQREFDPSGVSLMTQSSYVPAMGFSQSVLTVTVA